ncbi:MAG TPA: aminotransferase class V-fold PLP-dependent enzyme [Saliniramus sp.]|nr:aminotransferase class V-fold PLP-dependent enzyme [Saliniramus sp.]
MAADIYATLGVRRRINAAGTLTRLGGSLMAPQVVEAMAQASRASVDIAELQAAASARIAQATGAEAGLVTSGAAAALTLATAACLTRWNIARMSALPHAEAFPHEILLHRSQRTGYSRAFEAAGARLVDFGHNDRSTGAGVRGIEPWEIEAAITERTAALAFSATPDNGADLTLAARICSAKGIPVIVDAAAQLPPKSNLRRFIELGADLVAFSGGKAIGGPQASGILAGRRDLVGAALVQQIDMDVTPESWEPPGLIDREAMGGVPHHGLGRGFKVGKEEIVGLIVALERFCEADDGAANAALGERLRVIAETIADCPGIGARVKPAAETGRVPVLEIALDTDAIAFSRDLQRHDPPIHLSERHATRGILLIDPQALQPDDDAEIAKAIRALSRKNS